jgi:L-cysteine:1D-myo-inositol 2-amino-2-deoxy-alpha-D-glucopyranoside ligase
MGPLDQFMEVCVSEAGPEASGAAGRPQRPSPTGASPTGASPIVLDGPPDGPAPLALPGTVTVYVCGITPYDAAHVGHAFTYVAFDTLIRYLRSRGHEVRYCQNVTDVDDDVLRRAARDDEDYLQLGRRETADFLRQMDALNVARPTVFPKATEEVDEMVDLTSTLMERGNAYEVDGTVFFDVTTYPEFGTLSGYPPEELYSLLAERGGDPTDGRKRNPLDFILWQRSAPGEPSWPSPWGPGRPGWHTECSAMARKYLGTTVDLHGGGSDLIYPHHESERAQSEAANGVRFVRRWLHTGMVRYQGEKMSKSLGNLVFARDLLRDHDAAAVRLALLDHHYSSAWEFDLAELEPAEARLDRWRGAAGRAGVAADALPVAVDRALADDLDTRAALARVDELAAAGDGAAVRRAAAVLGVQLAREG